jgi:threonine synthase
LEAGTINVKGKRVVAICTGHGMKDPDIVAKQMAAPLVLPARLSEIEEAVIGEK